MLDEMIITDEPSTSARRRPFIPDHVHARTLHDVARFFDASDATLTARIHELEREWSLERTLQAKFATLSLLGLAASFANRRLLALPIAATGLLLLQALRGWNPAEPVLRIFGLRTAAEIDQEILALRILRGDFLEQPTYPESLLAAAEPNA